MIEFLKMAAIYILVSSLITIPFWAFGISADVTLVERLSLVVPAIVGSVFAAIWVDRDKRND